MDSKWRTRKKKRNDLVILFVLTILRFTETHFSRFRALNHQSIDALSKASVKCNIKEWKRNSYLSISKGEKRKFSSTLDFKCNDTTNEKKNYNFSFTCVADHTHTVSMLRNKMEKKAQKIAHNRTQYNLRSALNIKSQSLSLWHVPLRLIRCRTIVGSSISIYILSQKNRA